MPHASSRAAPSWPTSGGAPSPSRSSRSRAALPGRRHRAGQAHGDSCRRVGDARSTATPAEATPALRPRRRSRRPRRGSTGPASISVSCPPTSWSATARRRSSTPAFGEFRSIATALGGVGLDWAAVGHVILTHKHDDHAGSAAEVLDAATSATGYAGAEDLAAITSPRDLVAVADGDAVFGLRIVATPGTRRVMSQSSTRSAGSWSPAMHWEPAAGPSPGPTRSSARIRAAKASVAMGGVAGRARRPDPHRRLAEVASSRLDRRTGHPTGWGSWGGLRGSNPQPAVPQTAALPLS